MNKQGMLTALEAAELAGVSRQMVTAAIRGGELSAERFAGAYMIDVEAFKGWVLDRVRRAGRRGRTKPMELMRATSVYLPLRLIEWLDGKVGEEGTSRSEMIVEMLQAEYQKEMKKNG